MPLFDAYVMIDWSGGDRRRGGKNDCIWIAHGRRAASSPTTWSPRSRTDAENALRPLLLASARVKERVLICADFAYGYPAGFSLLLGGATKQYAPWRAVWAYLTAHVRDDLGTAPKALPSNRSNRFAVANAINAVASVPGSRGPFWCLFRPGSHPHIPQARPAQPFVCASGPGSIRALRLTDVRARSDTAFRLFGTGSVGSQALTGIPRLEALRFDPQLEPHSVVWPFETGWAPTRGPWIGRELLVVHAEIYPSVLPPLPDTIKDRGQVRAMWHWARDLDVRGRLVNEFAIPHGIVARSPDDITIRNEEGWILGCP